jgi:hypothetical protein
MAPRAEVGLDDSVFCQLAVLQDADDPFGVIEGKRSVADYR